MRIRRADLPEQNSQAVYQRMQTERQREAAEFRAPRRTACAGNPLARRSRGDRPGRRSDLAIRADPRRGRRHPQPDLRRRLQPRSRISSLSIARCRPTRMVCSPTIRGWCSSRTPVSSASSTIRRAIRARQPRSAPAAPPVRQEAGRHVGFPGRAGTGVRDRRPGVRGLSGPGQARDGERAGNAGEHVCGRSASARQLSGWSWCGSRADSPSFLRPRGSDSAFRPRRVLIPMALEFARSRRHCCRG